MNSFLHKAKFPFLAIVFFLNLVTFCYGQKPMLIEPNSDCHDSTQNKLSNLLKQRELLNKSILKMIPESEPIPRQLIPPMVETFQTAYKNGLNSGINSYELLIKWNKILEFTDLEASKTDPNVFIACY